MLVDMLLADIDLVINPVLPVQTSGVNTVNEETCSNEAEGGQNSALSARSEKTPTPPGFHVREPEQQHQERPQQHLRHPAAGEPFQHQQLHTVLDQQREQINTELKNFEDLKQQQQEINRYRQAQATQVVASAFQQQQQLDLVEQQQQLIRQLQNRNQQLEQANRLLQRQNNRQQQQPTHQEEVVRRIPKEFHRAISMLFRFITPPMSEEDKIFIIKKNMCVDYAIIVAAANPTTVNELVRICSSYDDTRRLLNCQRKIPLPHSSLLEPNFATPVQQQRSNVPPTNQRFSRVNTIEEEEPTFSSDVTQQSENEELQAKIEELEQQVCAFKMQLNRQRGEGRPMGVRSQEQMKSFQRQPDQQFHLPRRQPELQQASSQWLGNPVAQTYSHETVRQASNPQPQLSARSQPFQVAIPQDSQRNASEQQLQQHQAASGSLLKVCWNCDEEGHRFTDCPRPQAILFCYRCGRKGYSLRSCFTCRTDSGNLAAENRQ
ncbi:zinc finger protein 853-like [Uranotaenia lowii]|uniref:zinc finger protein 853-like n=1 Tax=Uranotaenia lowii TaxID=190385 RepID=UPI0024789EC1|nr:zinc finger protein 853-like [Uranotaenia lowii]